MEEDNYGINKEYAHKRAIELIPEEFFWSGTDETAPFGSDEGDTALSEFRRWKKKNPYSPTYECLKWTIESISEMNIRDYNDIILNRDLIKEQIEDDEFEDHYHIFTVDISVIATGFGELVDEGEIDVENKPIIHRAIKRQKIWAELSDEWIAKDKYIENLNVLERVLKDA